MNSSFDRCIRLFLQDIEPFDFSVQRPGRYTEGLGCFGLITVRLTKRILNQIPLTFLDILDRLRSDFLSVSRRIVLQVHWLIRDRDVLTIGYHHGAFNDALEFPNVAWPGII